MVGVRLGAERLFRYEKRTSAAWQLTHVVADSMIRNRRLVSEDMAPAHVQAYRQSTIGLDKTIIQATQELELWTTSHGQQGRKPWVPADNTSRGNGVAMKVAPLALFHQRKEPRHLSEDVRKLGQMTHGDSLAWITAYAVALIINDITRTGECEPARLVSRIRSIEGKYAGQRLVKDTFSRRLNDMMSPYFRDASLDDVLLITGDGFDAVESVSVAIACAMRHLDDPRAGLLEAVSCGCDRDTNASMTGAILGALNGIEGWPEEWRTPRPEYAAALDLATRLHAAAQYDSR
jgi:ADP-ribosylglycohydrolase